MVRNIFKTTVFTSALSLITIVTVFIVQLNGAGKITTACSYLDPITIDILAFSAALFLVIEGIFRIAEHKNSPLHHQITRAVRIAFGSAIITLHVMQFVHK